MDSMNRNHNENNHHEKILHHTGKLHWQQYSDRAKNNSEDTALVANKTFQSIQNNKSTVHADKSQDQNNQKDIFDVRNGDLSILHCKHIHHDDGCLKKKKKERGEERRKNLRQTEKNIKEGKK